ncbi:MAG: YdbH domain-containing protein [Desulfobacterales bacterium]
MDFRKLDLAGADFGPLRLGSPQNPAVVIRSLQLDYSPGGLYQKKIKKVVASGVELYCEYKNGRWGLRDFDLEKLLIRLNSKKEKEKISEDESPVSFPGRIEINNGTLICILEKSAYRLPFEFVTVTEEKSAHILKALARIYPRGQAVHVSAQIDLRQNRITSQVTAKKVDLLKFADIVKSIDGLSLAGFASLEAKAELQFAPFKVSSISGRLNGSAINIRYKSLQFRNRSDHPDKEKPFIIDLKGTDHQSWKVTLSGLTAKAPIAANISDVTATAEPSEEGYKIAGNFKLSFDSSADLKTVSVPLSFKRPFALPLKFSAVYAKNGKWRFDLANGDRKQSGLEGADIEYENIHITTEYPGLHLSGKAIGNDIRTAYHLRIAAVQIHSGDVNLLFPQLVLKGKADFNRAWSRDLSSIFNVNLSGAALKLNPAKIKFNDLTGGGTWRMDRNGLQQISGTVNFADTHLESVDGNIRLRQSQGAIPLKFPAENSAEKGKVTIAAVEYQKLNLGAVNAEIQQTASGVFFNAKLKNQLIPQLSAKFSGSADFFGTKAPETRTDFELFYPETAPEVDLGKFLPAAKGFTFDGMLLERGRLVIGKAERTANSESSLSNGKLRHRDHKIELEGIGLKLIISDLLEVRSSPGQKLTFDRASIGGLNIENGEIDFQIESARSLLIEKSHFSWSDGMVDAPAIRLRSDIQDYRLILYCDRLDLEKVLEQFGVAEVEAEGELNGRIPLRYKNGRLSFQDGFLFTTPGESGKIRMTDTEILTAGIPADTPQYVQMELARKALEDYDYTWAKLNLTTEGEDLLLKMQLDGKPAKSLPFVYKKDMGSFAKVEAGVQGSTFQGIRLDVNFRLPLNKILQYKDLIRMMQKSKE